MARTSLPVALSVPDQAQLQQWACAQGTPQHVALRCRLVLAAAVGQSDLAIAAAQGVNRHSAALWRGRVRTAGIQTVWEIQAGRGRKPQYAQARRDALIATTLQTKPKGMTHWSCRTIAQAHARFTGANPRIHKAVAILEDARRDGCTVSILASNGVFIAGYPNALLAQLV